MSTPAHPLASPQLDAHHLHLGGEVDIYQAATLKTRLQEAVASSPRLALDLSAVIHLDCAGVQVLLLAARSATQRGGAVRIARHSQATEEVFARLNLARHFAHAAEEHTA